ALGTRKPISRWAFLVIYPIPINSQLSSDQLRPFRQFSSGSLRDFIEKIAGGPDEIPSNTR
ncbi:hypothetical protein, partial [Sphingobacterium sp. UBA7249]|uniref:hypothetical protein n=1 Tax=Sphingobacterium sp. UBA7249 TaxID=1947516 RepID=UPI0025FE818B